MEANIEYHTRWVDAYDEQPHFLPENKKRVKELLLEYGKESGFDSILDLGCGTGFILNIAKKYFRSMVGIDITPGMIKKIGNIKNSSIYLADSESLPFKDNCFNICTGHAFLHHLFEFEPTLTEVYRVLKKGGILYTDQDPNLYFWDNSVAERAAKTLEKEKGIPEDVTKLAEYHDALGGIDGDKIKDLLYTIGYREVEVTYIWFVPEGTSKETKKSNMKYIRIKAKK